jgi:hypothetical protein
VIWDFVRQPKPSNARSVDVSRLPLDLSLIPVLRLWIQLLVRQLEWRKSYKWLTDNLVKEKGAAKTVKAVKQSLDQLGWNVPLEGFTTRLQCCTSSLTRMLSAAWLATSDLEHLSNILQSEIDDLMIPAKIVTPDWAENLARARAISKTSPSHFSSSSSTSHIRRLGQLLITGSVSHIGGTANVGGKHWVSFVVSSELREILVGDSLLAGGVGAIDKGERVVLVESLRWWLWQSAEIAGCTLPPFSVGQLRVQQQSDAHLCGIYAHNSLQSFFNHALHPRLSVQSMRQPRAELFLSVVEFHNDHLNVRFVCLDYSLLHFTYINHHISVVH